MYIIYSHFIYILQFLKKSNEEAARQYLGLAAAKANEAANMLKMGVRMDVLATQI